jgi:hypothetical protein
VALLESESVATLLYVARNMDTAASARISAANPPSLLADLELQGPLVSPLVSPLEGPLVNPHLRLYLFRVKVENVAHVAVAMSATGTVRILVCAAHNGDTAEKAVSIVRALLLGQLLLKLRLPRKQTCNRKLESGILLFQAMQTVAVPASATS